MPRRKDPQRPLLVGGVALLGVAAGLYFGGLRGVAQWLVLAGALLCFLYFVIRRTAAVPEASKHPESALFGQSTSMEAQLDPDKRDPKQ
jgi:hypothetical protein